MNDPGATPRPSERRAGDRAAVRVAAFVALLGAGCLGAGCSTNPSTVLELVSARGADGGQVDPLTQPPQVATLVVQELDDLDGDVQLLADASLPAASIDLAIAPGGDTHTITVMGYDADGGVVVFGATQPLPAGGVDQAVVPGVFVQRTGQMAVMPGALSEPRQLPLLEWLYGDTLFVSGEDTSSDLYDLTWYSARPSPPVLPFIPRSIAVSPCGAPNVAGGTCGVAWLFGSGDALTQGCYLDFAASPPVSTAFTLPGPGSFADIAGGLTITDGVHLYVVGGTGASGPSRRTLAIDPTDTTDDAYPYGYPSWAAPYAPRQGASAVWAGAYGLVVLGGTSTNGGQDAAPQADIEQVLGFSTPMCPPGQSPPSLSVTGAGAALLPGGAQVLLGGGLTGGGQDSGVLMVDLGACTITPWTSLPTALASAQVFVIDANDAVVVGNEAPPSYATHVFRVSPAGAIEVPTVVPHANASAVAWPVDSVDPGSFLLFGGPSGGSTWLESFMPPPP